MESELEMYLAIVVDGLAHYVAALKRPIEYLNQNASELGADSLQRLEETATLAEGLRADIDKLIDASIMDIEDIQD
jgi:hypothetical protein